MCVKSEGNSANKIHVRNFAAMLVLWFYREITIAFHMVGFARIVYHVYLYFRYLYFRRG